MRTHRSVRRRCLPQRSLLTKAVDDCLAPRDRVLEECQEETEKPDLIDDLRQPLAYVCTAESEAESSPGELLSMRGYRMSPSRRTVMSLPSRPSET
jgi:hypothetical protein